MPSGKPNARLTQIGMLCSMGIRFIMHQLRLPIILVLFLTALITVGSFIFPKVAALNTVPLYTIYEDQLTPGWINWSWNTNVTFDSAEKSFNGTKAVKFITGSWGGLYLHTDTALSTSNYTAIQFSLYTESPNARFGVILYDSNNQSIGSTTSIVPYGGELSAGSWKTYTIPLEVFPVGNKQVSGFALQEITGSNQGTHYIDSITFQGNAPSPTPTPTIIPTATPSSTPSATPIPTATMSPTTTPTATPNPTANTTSNLRVYSDGLHTPWVNWSWNSDVNLSANSVVYEGINAISYTANAPWAAMYLHTDNPVSTANYQSLDFSLRASQNNQQYNLLFYNSNSQVIGQVINLATYGGQPTANTWKTYSIPLPANTNIAGIALQESKGTNQPALYIDAVSFVTKTTVSPTPTPTSTLLASATPVATPAPHQKFVTLAPGSTLPSGQECATRIGRSAWEPRPQNYTANHTTGITVANIDGTTSEGNAKFAPRIDGNFTGTTDEIIQWGACKWGFDEDVVRAVATKESWWRQSEQGDFNGTNYESYGLLQVRRTYHAGTYPTSANSTPFNVDYALAWRRSCFEGYFSSWIPASAKGDEWGCVGLWFSGSWYDAGAKDYISKVQQHLNDKTWLQPGF